MSYSNALTRSRVSARNIAAAVAELTDFRSASAGVDRLGIVVHPTRRVGGVLEAIKRWSDDHCAEIVQTVAPCLQPDLAPDAPAAQCDLIVAIGGDGTTLAAIHAAAEFDRPVLGVACGSLGVLTTIAPRSVSDALDRFAAGDWVPRWLPALAVSAEPGSELTAFNDLVVVRGGAGQIRVRIHVDGELYSRLAGDGAIVSTPMGSSAYALSAGGPLLAEATDAFVVTPLVAQGGACPPLVMGGDTELRLDVGGGYGGMRLELDGQLSQLGLGASCSLAVTLRRDAAVLVGFSDQETLLAGLRRRGVIRDSPRILVERARRSAQ